MFGHWQNLCLRLVLWLFVSLFVVCYSTLELTWKRTMASGKTIYKQGLFHFYVSEWEGTHALFGQLDWPVTFGAISSNIPLG